MMFPWTGQPYWGTVRSAQENHGTHEQAIAANRIAARLASAWSCEARSSIAKAAATAGLRSGAS